MPTIQIEGLNINYIQQGTQGLPLVCLHGWGQNIEMMQMITNHFEHDFIVTVLDFPGFGLSDEPKESWSVQDYANFLKQFLTALNIANPIFVGHSFGCRVATRYAVDHPVLKMVFTGGAGIKPKRKLQWYVNTYSYKAAKTLFKLPGLKQYEENMKKKFGSTDYKNSSGIMRKTLVKVVNDDTTELLALMKMPVLLVWGDKDDQTPLWMAKVMEEKMANAGLAVFENDDHYAYFHQWDRFNRVLDNFFKNEKGKQHD